SGKNALTRIRNQFAFHYGSDEIREQLSSPNDDLVLRLYAHKQRANCLSQFAEQVVSMTIFTDHTAFEKAVNDCDTLYNNFLEFAQRCIVLILQRHVNDKVTGSWPIVEIEDPPFIDELRLPFYLRTRQVDSS
ncbi:MAG TPA: hypothetical protein PLP17_14635, partial [Oligoflexia bacterium]|nr:hypothetical protein [Oligoflexia bacterium]